MKKIISFLTCFIFAMSFIFSSVSTEVQAKENTNNLLSNDNLKIVVDNNIERKVESTFNGEKTITTYNKITKSISIQKNGKVIYSASGKELINSYNQLANSLDSNNSIGVNAVVDPGEGGASWSIIDQCNAESLIKGFQYSFVKYRESGTNNIYWYLKRRGVYTPYVLQTSSNSGAFTNYASSVYSMFSASRSIAAKVGTSTATVLIGALVGASIATGGAAAVVAAIVGGYGTMSLISDCNNLLSARDQADRWYNEIFR